MLRSSFQARFWFMIFVLFALAIWLLEPVLLPFAGGIAIAYFLNPVVDKLTHRHVPRWLGAMIVLACFGLVIVLLAVLIMPLLQDQIGALIAAIPGYIEKFRYHIIPWLENWLTRFSPDDVDKIRDAATQYVGNAAGMAGKAVQNVITSGLAFIDIMALAIITPVVAFYFMRDWPSVTRAVDSWIPRRHYETVKEQLAEIDTSLSGFVRGQALVCLGLGLVYSLGLTACGLQYSAAIGVTAGVLSFIPYVGTAFAWVVSIMLALVQFDDMTRIGFVVGVLLLGHIMESYVLTPRLVGHRVGLHPVWILFALIAGGRLMGFTGILIAVPVAAVLGVLTRFAFKQYKSSSLYEEPSPPKQIAKP